MRKLCTVLALSLLCQSAFAETEKCPGGKGITETELTQTAKSSAFACFKRSTFDKAEAQTPPAALAQKITGTVCKNEIEKWNRQMLRDIATQCGKQMQPEEMLPKLNNNLTTWLTGQITAARSPKK